MERRERVEGNACCTCRSPKNNALNSVDLCIRLAVNRDTTMQTMRSTMTATSRRQPATTGQLCRADFKLQASFALLISEERLVGKDSVSKFRCRWSTYN